MDNLRAELLELNFLEFHRDLKHDLKRLNLEQNVDRGLVNEIKNDFALNSNSSILNNKEYFDYYLIIRALDNHHIHIAKLLIELGCRVYKKTRSNQETTVLEAAVESSGDSELITILLAKGASKDILIPTKENKTPFHLAIDRDQLSTVKLFLSQFDVETLNGKNFLHYAVEQDKITLVSEMIEKGLSLKKKNDENLTPFCLALINKNFKILNRLLSYCTVKNIKGTNYDDVAPVYIASICGYLKLIKKYADFGSSIDKPLMSSKEPWSCLTNFSGFTLLHLAVQHNQLEVVKFLLKAGANVAVKNNDGSSPLHLAFEIKEKGIWETWQDFDDNNSIIDLILEANMKIKSNPVNKQKLSHFHIACSRDEPTVVEHFLKHGAVVNQPTKSRCHRYKGFYPLHFAAKFRCKRTLEFLLKNGADVKTRNFRKMTALHVAAQESCLDTVRLLLEYGADITSMDSEGNSPVHLAFKNKNYAVIDLLLSVHIEIHSNPTNVEGLSHFHIACTRNNDAVVKGFIENGESIDTCVPEESDDFSAAPWAGYSPLHFAVSHNRAKIVQMILNSGAMVEVKNSKGYTPLHLACQCNYEMFGEFIKSTLHDFQKHGKVALHVRPITDATKSENYFGGFDNCTGKFDWRSNRLEHLKIMTSLLKYNSDVNSIDSNGNTPIYYAYAAVDEVSRILEKNMKDCSEDLLNQIVESLSKELYERRKLILNNLLKLDVNLDKCYENSSILHYICFKDSVDERDVEMMQLFLENGADANIYDRNMVTPLHLASSNGNQIFVRTLLNYDVNVDCIHSEDNATPLLMAAANQMHWCSCTNIMKMLIDKGANVNAKNSAGKTALHYLPQQDEIWFMDIQVTNLIEAGANINSQDLIGHTPLHVACSQQKVGIAKAFLMCGADINVQDDHGNGVCCYLYNKYLKNLSTRQRRNLSAYMKQLIILLQNHVMKMKVFGLPISQEELASCAKFYDFVPQTDQKKRELIDGYECEVQILRDTKINDYYSLYNVVFKNENALAILVKNPRFKSIMESKSFEKIYPNYGYLIRMKYQAGVSRAKLLPTAKSVLKNMIGLDLPHSCSEKIFSYFTNCELSESIQVLSKVLNSNSNTKSSTMQLRSRRTHKRQKVY